MKYNIICRYEVFLEKYTQMHQYFGERIVAEVSDVDFLLLRITISSSAGLLAYPLECSFTSDW